MDVSVFRARAFGLYLLITGVSIPVKRATWREVARELRADKVLTSIVGLLALMLGLVLVLTHNVWEASWRVSIMLLCWLVPLRGVLYVLLPHGVVARMLRPFDRGNWHTGGGAGIVSIVLISLAPRIAFLNKLTGGTYEGWKNLKKYIGIFFIIAFIHSLTVKSPLDAFIAINWVQIFFIIGTVSYLYTEIFGRFFKKYLPYAVEAVKHPNNSTTEVTLRAKKDSIQKQRAGQFLFVRFPRDKDLNESHPFTISSAPSEDVLRLTIKASGDFTRELFAQLKEGANAIVEGPYGMFNYKTGGSKQIWIAGGIGLTPFLSFLRDMDGSLAHDVDLYYTVRHPEEAIFLEEIEAADQKNPRLKVYIRYSAKDGSLKIEDIVKNAGGDVHSHHVYMCGPLPMTMAFEKKFLDLGLPKDNLHYEEFNFR